MACQVEANGVSINCACDGCGIAYNHSTKTYHILCCGSITTTTLSIQPVDPEIRPGRLTVDISGAPFLQVAQLLDHALPGKVVLPTNVKLKSLGKKLTIKGPVSAADLARRAGVEIKGKASRG